MVIYFNKIVVSARICQFETDASIVIKRQKFYKP